MSTFDPVGPAGFPALEERILRFWKEARIFEKTLELRKDAPEWVFYEGPPTANGRPGIHHVESRTFKDVYPRYKTMTGHRVPRKAGWDCHGLPVELEVEKEIGTRSKREIEEFGIAEFNRLCRESVTRYVEDWERLTERIGFWIDLSQAYWTMTPGYIESVWWSLRELHRRGLLFEDDRITAYCPRCGTGLSDHEVSLGYTQVRDPSVEVRFPIVEAADPSLVGSSLLVWTTTPWTLISNTGAAVAPDETYVVAASGERSVILAEARIEVLGEGWEVTRRLDGEALVGARYEPPFPNIDPGVAHRVVGASFVGMDEGTGIVHLAPAFGAEDLAVGKAQGWPVFNPVDDQGRFTDRTSVGFVRGRFVKEADADIIEDLRARDLLMRAATIEHTYPLCWRCDTPLLYYARPAWYIRTTARKERLLEVNERVAWYPDHIKHGRFGDWLENNVDWSLSRERYWGTPLPVWRCREGHATVVGSLAELSDLAGRDVRGIDPHRPQIDEVEIRCPSCGSEARRVPEVIDAWYDSGAMPFAQWDYHPDLGRGTDGFAARFPADFISEAVDQTRGWFYSLMAEGVLLFDETAFRNCVVLGHVVDADGRKMSKRLGNVIDPFSVVERQGADAVRWFMLTSGSPWQPRRVSMEILDEVVRRFLLTLWNVYSFFVTYANADGVDPTAEEPPGERPALDRWILSQLHRTIGEARDGLERYDATAAGRRIERFVDDLSNWYVRRARRRFWDPTQPDGASPSKAAAYATLHTCLTTLARLLAPFTPFVADALWANLAAGRAGQPESVHLSDYPLADPDAVDEELDAAMQTVREVVELGRRVRNDARVKVRQPLPRAVLHLPGDPAPLAPLAPLIADELNVKEVAFASSTDELAGWRAKPNYRVLGPRLGPRVKAVASALAGDDGSLAAALATGSTVSLEVDGEAVELGPEDVDLARETAGGWGIVSEGGLTVALDLEITPELRSEGLAREVVRVVQDARKAAGLDVADRIELSIESDGEVLQALRQHGDWVAAEVLAEKLRAEALPEAEHRSEVELEAGRVTVALRRRG